MMDLIKKNVKFIVVMIFVIVLGIVGIAYAIKVSNFNPIALNVTTAPIDVNITYDSGANGANITSNGKMVPISDNLVTGVNVTDERVIKAKFRVNGVSSNPNNTIYDVALRDISAPCELRTEDVKWRLYKNGNLLSSGNLSPTFDVISDNRLVLTETQQDLTTTTDEYVFLMWISESCTGDISTCTSELDQSKYLNKSFGASIKIELSTKSKKTLVRNTGSANSCSFSTTSVPIFNTLTYTGGSQVLVNDGNGYTLINNTGTNASSYAVTAKLNDGYKWADGTTDDKIIKGKINKRAATIIASNQSISSGASIDNTKYTAVDLLSGHTVSSVFLDASTVKVGVGSITPTRASIIDASGNDVTSNYDISYVGGTLTIGCSNDSSITTTLPSSLTYGTGGTYSYTTSPSNLIVSCTSSNTSIATCSVDTSSKKITITPKGTGSVNITLTGTNPNISNECSSVSTSKAITINCSNTAIEPTVSSSQNYTGSIITGVTGGTNVTLGGTVSATNAGTYSGTATPSKGYCWNDKTTSTKSYSWAINKAASTCTISSTPTLKYPGASTGNISYSCTGDGNISLNSSNTNVISVGNIGSTSTTLTAKSTGNSTITLKRNEGTNYLASSAVTKSITVGASTYTLTYNNNGGSGCSSKTVTYGSTYGTMCTPTRSGYIFIGWFDSNYKDSPLNYYADTYADLKNAFGYDADKLYNHYLTYGKNENRRISQYISSDTYNTAGNKTLYAGWKAASKPVITTINNKSGGKWVNYAFDIYVYATDEIGISRIEWSYDQKNWYYDDMTTPTKQSDGSYESHGTWSADRNQLVYFRALNTNGLYSDIKSTNIKIDRTKPSLTVKIISNGSTIYTCTSSSCTVPSEVNKITLNMSASDSGSGLNSNYVFKYDWPIGSSTFGSENRTFNSSGTDSRDIDTGGNRTFKFEVSDNVGNITNMVITVSVSTANTPNDGHTHYFGTSYNSHSAYYPNYLISTYSFTGSWSCGNHTHNAVIGNTAALRRCIYCGATAGELGASGGTLWCPRSAGICTNC